MPYSADSLIVNEGEVIVTEAVIDAFFMLVGKERFKDSAPDKQYLAPPPGIGRAVLQASRRFSKHVNHVILAAQSAHETGGWQSWWARIARNSAGIGVDGRPGVGERFDTLQDTFDAQAAHQLNYSEGIGDWSSTDPRYPDNIPRNYLGVAKTPRGWNGRWATPGTTYGQEVAAMANRLVAFAKTFTGGLPVATVIAKPPMVIRHSARFDGYGHPREYLAFVDHIATGSRESNLSWLADGSANANQPSVNYYIDKPGTIYEIVPYQHAPWTNGWKPDVDLMATYRPNLNNPVVKYWFNNKINPNTGSITTEHEGEASDRLTQAQIISGGWLKAWLHQETQIPLDPDHWFGHNQIDGVNRPYCPSFDPDEWAALRNQAIARVVAVPLPSVPVIQRPPENVLILPGQPDNIPFVEGFRAHLLRLGAVVNPQDPALGALSIFGYAKEAEWYDQKGDTYQETERYYLHYQKGQLPPWDIIGLHRGEVPPPHAK